MARIAPFSIGISYVLPVRLSTILSVCRVWSMKLSTLHQGSAPSIQRRPALVASRVYNGVPASRDAGAEPPPEIRIAPTLSVSGDIAEPARPLSQADRRARHAGL